MNPEIFKHIELLLGSVGLIIALFFGAFMIISKEQQKSANIFLAIYLLAFSLRIGKSLFYNYFPINPIVRNVFLGMLLAIGPSLWLYVKNLSANNKKEGHKVLQVHYIPLLFFVGFCWLIPNDGSQLSRMIFIVLLLHILGYGIYTLYYLFRNKEQLIVKEKKTYTWLFFLTLLTMLMSLIQIGVFFRWVPYLSTAFLFSIVVITLAIWGLKNVSLFKIEPKKYTGSTISDQNATIYLDKLIYLMKEEKLYLDPEITLTKLSDRIGITSKQLSQIINQHQNENYSQFIARYRVEEAKKLLSMPAYKNFKIAAIAYESGFNSISSFNASFKKITNTTALKYRESLS
ncbi:hypothetical protein GCM10009430_24820 [Aquimarina litoralis]|uniref:HTH araC/xylS-type domain-containing protein n=1 Tax=Aquimarina litoralis TaxID=584605 RepID=A0ABN1IVV3_9FLAO